MGDVIRGFGLLTDKEFAGWFNWGVAFAMAGDLSGLKAPNWIPLPPVGFPTTGPPLGIYPVGPVALIVTEDLRL